MRASAIIAALAVAGTSSLAAAETIKAPAGWKLDAAQSRALTEQLRPLGPFGIASQRVTNVDVYVPPASGVVLSVAIVVATIPEQREAAARAAIDELHATSQRAALTGGSIVEDGWQEKVDAEDKQIEATLAWRDTKAQTSSTARRLIVADNEGHLAALTGECFAGEGAAAQAVAACKAALATLDPGIPAAKRVALALAPAGTRPTAVDSPEAAAPSDVRRTPLPPMTLPPPEPTTDLRPVYVGAGLVVLAAAFWWNRRRRNRFEEQSS